MQIPHVGHPVDLGWERGQAIIHSSLQNFGQVQFIAMPRSISKQPPASVEYFTVWERQVRRDTHHVIQRTNTNSPPTLRRWGEVGEVESASAKNSRGFDFAQSVCGACASVTRHFSPFKSTLRTTVGGWRQINPREQTRRNWAWSVFMQRRICIRRQRRTGNPN